MTAPYVLVVKSVVGQRFGEESHLFYEHETRALVDADAAQFRALWDKVDDLRGHDPVVGVYRLVDTDSEEALP